jgi:hypothetical protein
MAKKAAKKAGVNGSYEKDGKEEVMMNNKKIEIEIENDDEGVIPADRQAPSNRKYMTYDSKNWCSR